MSESALKLAFADCANRVARYLGYKEGDSNRTTQQNDDIDRAVQSGYRRFLYPPKLPGQQFQHQWSFLEPIATITTVAGTYKYDVPADFAYLAGVPVIQETNINFSQTGAGIQVVGTNEILRQRSLISTNNSTPRIVAEFQNHEDSANQSQFWFYPTPDKVYTIQFKYQVEPLKFSTAHLGGPAYSEVIIAAALASAEEQMEESTGVHYQRFLELLSGAISHDINRGTQVFGYNGDGGSSRANPHRLRTVTHVNDV